MIEPRRKPGPKKGNGPISSNAGISLYPHEKEVLDRLVVKFGAASRSDVVRMLLAPKSQIAA